MRAWAWWPCRRLAVGRRWQHQIDRSFRRGDDDAAHRACSTALRGLSARRQARAGRLASDRSSSEALLMPTDRTYAPHAAAAASAAGGSGSVTGAGHHRIVPYDARWDARARELIAKLRDGLGAVAVRIDHIGSTAVRGLGARPIIDVQVSVADVLDRSSFEPRLNALGYEHFAFPELPVDDYLVYVPSDGSNTQHVSVCQVATRH